MKAILRIPYAEKDEAKLIAKQNHCALFFTDSKQWQLLGDSIPALLEKYIISIENEDVPNSKVSNSKTKVMKTTNEKKPTTKKPSKVIKEVVVKQKPYHHILEIPFILRKIVGVYGAYYDSHYKTYILPRNEIPYELEKYRSKAFSFEAHVEKEINEKLKTEMPVGIQTFKDDLFAINKEDIITPRDYQKQAYKVMKKGLDYYNGFLLADEVGLGKTISAGLVAQEKQYNSVLIITTVSAIAHWRKTLIKMNVDKSKDIVIMNYERLQKLIDADTKKYKKVAKTRKTKNKRLANSGTAKDFDLIIWDESHKMKNNTSMRFKLGQKLALAATHNLYLSATAGQNPLELSYLSLLLSEITGESVSSMEEFEKWCMSMDLGISRGKFGKWQWDGKQESIDKIHTMLFKGKPPAALRRTPVDIAGYPEISRQLTPFELNPDEQEQYELAWNEFKSVMLDYKKSRRSKTDNHAFVAKLRLRQKSSILKIPYTVEYIENLLEQGHQVAVSVNFKETIEEIEKQLLKSKITCSKIQGGLTATEKEEERMKFQTGQNKVILFSVEEAISLHQGEYNNAPRSLLIHDLRWSAISMSQIEGRTHRDGKFSQAYWLYFADTIEEDIAKIVLNRAIGMKAMIGDDTKVLKDIEDVLHKRI